MKRRNFMTKGLEGTLKHRSLQAGTGEGSYGHRRCPAGRDRQIEAAVKELL